MSRRLLAASMLCVPVAAAAAHHPHPGARAGTTCRAGAAHDIRDGFPTAPVRHSTNGVLRTRLRLASKRIRVNGTEVTTNLFEGHLPGPTLVVCPGDRLDVDLDNRMPNPTSLHTHGLHVDPRGLGDNVLRHVMPDTRGAYHYRIPANHPAGTYWYHPHAHGQGETQISGGLAGALIVAGGRAEQRSGLARIPQRTMLLQRMTVANGAIVGDNGANPKDARVLVNGALRPRLKMTQGKLQRWRLVNASADAFLRLRVPGAAFRVVGTDGNPVARPYRVSSLLLAPGERRDVLVRGTPNTSGLVTRSFDAGFVKTAPQTIAPIVTRRSRARPQSLPRGSRPPEDLRRAHVAARRRIVFSEQFPKFFINGKTYDPDRIDYTVTLGTAEEWEIVNDSYEWHTFHIHQNPVQVVSRDGRRQRRLEYDDDPPLAPHHRMMVRMRFRDYPGVIPFHCHMLSHQDGGMMSLIRIVRPGQRTSGAPEHMHHHGGGMDMSGMDG